MKLKLLWCPDGWVGHLSHLPGMDGHGGAEKQRDPGTSLEADARSTTLSSPVLGTLPAFSWQKPGTADVPWQGTTAHSIRSDKTYPHIFPSHLHAHILLCSRGC